MTSTVGRLRADSSSFSSRPGRDDEDPAVASSAREDADEVAWS